MLTRRARTATTIITITTEPQFEVLGFDAALSTCLKPVPSRPLPPGQRTYRRRRHWPTRLVNATFGLGLLAVVLGVLVFTLERVGLLGNLFDDDVFVVVSELVSALGAPLSITLLVVLIVGHAVTWTVIAHALGRRLRCAECGGTLRGVIEDQRLLRACDPCGFAWDMGQHGSGDHHHDQNHHHHHF